jgi:uncharacterized protein YbjQ (UPF0145 family)
MTNILITTTPTVENRPVREYLGIVSGMAFMRRWWLCLLVAAYDPDTFLIPLVIPLVLLESSLPVAASMSGQNFKAKFHKAQNWAIQQMAKEAASLGANAVIGVKIDYKTIGEF